MSVLRFQLKTHPRTAGLYPLVLLLVACNSSLPAIDPVEIGRLIDGGQAATASIELKNQLQAQPEQAQLRFLLGRALLELGEIAPAEIELRRAMSLGQPAATVGPQLARALLAQQRYEQVVEGFANTSYADAGATAELRTLVATAYRQQGKLTEAEEATADALALRPEHAPALLMQASLKAARGQSPEALALVSSVLRKEPQNLQAWVLQGQLQYARDDVEGALRSFSQALKIRTDSVSAHAALIALHLARADTSAAEAQWQAMRAVLPNNPRTRLYEAKLALLRGDAKHARNITVELLRVGNGNVELLLLAGAAELVLKSPVRAEALLERAVNASPQAEVPRLMLAQALMQSGQYHAAAETLTPLLQRNPPPTFALTLLAQARLMQGDAKAADQLFKRAGAYQSGSNEITIAAARVRARLDPTEAQFEELRKLSRTDTGGTADLALISAYLARGQSVQAFAAIDALARKKPETAEVDELRGQVLLKQQKLDEARQQFERALQKNPQHYPAAAGLAGIDLAQGKHAAATARFEAMRAQQPGHLQASLALAELQPESPQGIAAAAQLLKETISVHPDLRAPRLKLIELQMRSRAYTQAVETARAGVAALPRDPALQEALGQALSANGEVLQAISAFGQLANLTPSSARPHLRVAELQMAKQDFAAAKAAVRKALSAEPDSLVGLRLSAALAVRDKQLPQALAMAKEAQQRHPDLAAGFSMEGEVQVMMGDKAAAEKALKLAVGKRDASEAARQLHQLLLSGARPAEAARFAASWLNQHPRDISFRHALAERALTREDWAAAEQQYRIISEQRPLDAQALNNIAWLLVKQDKSGAVGFAKRSLQVSPDNPAVLNTLAQSYAHAGQLPKAIEVQLRAVSLAPEMGSLRLDMAKFYLAAGDHAKARDELGKLSKLKASSLAKAEAEQLLAKLESRP